MHRVIHIFAGGLLLFQLDALRASEGSDDLQSPVPIRTTTVPYAVAALDKVKLETAGAKVHEYQIGQDGMLDVGDGPFKAEGLSPTELESRVRTHTGENGAFSIEEFRSSRVTVLGEVSHPSFTEMGDGPMRVLDAIASANGFTPLANTRRVKLVRENAGQVEVYELDLRAEMKGDKSNQNILLKPGDVITVPRNFL